MHDELLYFAPHLDSATTVPVETKNWKQLR